MDAAHTDDNPTEQLADAPQEQIAKTHAEITVLLANAEALRIDNAALPARGRKPFSAYGPRSIVPPHRRMVAAPAFGTL